MKYLLIGSDGFVGTNLNKYGNLTYEKFDSGFLKGDVSFDTRSVDITQDLSPLEECIRGFGEEFMVINLAAIHHIPYCNENPMEAIFTNVYGNRRILELCKRNGCTRYIFASSGAVYQPSVQNHKETDYIESSDVYSNSKIIAENDLLNSGLKCSILRFFNIVGEHDLTPHLIPEIVGQVQNGKNKIEVGNLTTVRDYIHVTDVVKIIEMVLLDDNPPVIMNCGTGQGTSGQEIVTIIKGLVNQKVVFEQVAQKTRKSDRPSQVANNELLVKKYAFRNFQTVEKGIYDYFSWRKEF